MLYNKLEEWRRGEEDGLQGKEGRTLNVARAKLVMQEATMLSKISQNKNLANLEAKEAAVRDFLERASSPHSWSLRWGPFPEVLASCLQRRRHHQDRHPGHRARPRPQEPLHPAQV